MKRQQFDRIIGQRSGSTEFACYPASSPELNILDASIWDRLKRGLRDLKNENGGPLEQTTDPYEYLRRLTEVADNVSLEEINKAVYGYII